jgi:hypothetical protein
MRVAHERQKPSSEKWMGCKQAMDIIPDTRQPLINSKREEEVSCSHIHEASTFTFLSPFQFEDVEHNDEEDMYFEFEPTSKASKFETRNILVLISFIVFFSNILN